MDTWLGRTLHDIYHSITVIQASHKSEFVLPQNTPYLALMGELRGVFCDDIQENWLHMIAQHCLCLTELYETGIKVHW